MEKDLMEQELIGLIMGMDALNKNATRNEKDADFTSRNVREVKKLKSK